MALRYMLCDSDLKDIRVDLAESQTKSQPKVTSKLWVAAKRWLLRLSVLFILLCLFVLLAPNKAEQLWQTVTPGVAMVTAIGEDSQGPFAVVLGKLVHEGDAVEGYAVVRIHENMVELEKGGKRITRQLYTRPWLFRTAM